jgi:hypothetical protein
MHWVGHCRGEPWKSSTSSCRTIRLSLFFSDPGLLSKLNSLPNMRHIILATELTRMKAGNCCVAAWSLTEQRIVRPLKATGDYWSLKNEGHLFNVGNLLECDPTAVKFGDYPHRSENLPLKSMPRVITSLIEEEFYPLIAGHCAAAVADCFGAPLVQDRYLHAGTRCSSLAGVRTRRENVSFREQGDPPKLRLQLNDSDGSFYDLPVTSDVLYRFFGYTDGIREMYGVTELTEMLNFVPRDEDIILRLGLARAWDGKDNHWNPMRCYVQLNGLIFQSNPYCIFGGPPA